MKIKLKLGFMAVLLLAGLVFTSCTTDRNFERSLRSIANPYRLNLWHWEFNALKTSFHNDRAIDNGASQVLEYFATGEQIRALEVQLEQVRAGAPGDLTALEAILEKLRQQNATLVVTVETVLEKQLKDALREHDIYNPIDKYLNLKLNFPPVNFKLDNPPYLLVVSPRDKIERIQEILFRQTIRVAEMEAVESRIDALDVSALVVELGGFAIYPSFVTNRGGLLFTITTAIEEWVHQYLSFKPLGFRYLLDLSGISRNYEIATMNETVASMVSDELGTMVYQKYYAKNNESSEPGKNKGSGFDFNREMREIRRTVDIYLAQGEIERAEEFMRQKRDYLEQNGYHIRKLNQAYFAFHGTYADSPTSIDPIGVELKELRARSDSLKTFLETAAAMTSRQDLSQSIK